MYLSVQHKRALILAAVACTTISFYVLLPRDELDDGIIRLPLDANFTCGTPLKQDVQKVESYSFPDAQKYSYLFQGSAYSIPESQVPDVPVIVSGFSSNHFEEGMVMVDNVNHVGRKKFPNSKFIIYDIGLSSQERKQMQAVCNCEIIKFPFSKFPYYVKDLPTYTFKPLIIQMVAREHRFMMWIDTSIRFVTSDLEPLFRQAKQQGLMFTSTKGEIAMRTHPQTFRFLKEEPCTFRSVNEIQGGLQIIYGSSFIHEHYLKPWVSCALSFGCMVPERNSRRLVDCFKRGRVYHACHRFDQSVVGILAHRLFYENMDAHLISEDYMIVDK